MCGTIIFWISSVVMCAAAIRCALKYKRPATLLLRSGLGGLSALAAVILLSPTGSMPINLNFTSIFCSVVLGIPGVIMLTAAKLIMG